jgi:hypothetical protein
MNRKAQDLVKSLADHWEQLERTMPAGEWNKLVSELAALRARRMTAETELGLTEAFDELHAICLAHEAVRRLAPIRTRGFGSGSKVAQEEKRPGYVILLNRLFDLVDSASPPAQPKPPEPKSEKTTPREGAR